MSISRVLTIIYIKYLTIGTNVYNVHVFVSENVYTFDIAAGHNSTVLNIFFFMNCIYVIHKTYAPVFG